MVSCRYSSFLGQGTWSPFTTPSAPRLHLLSVSAFEILHLSVFVICLPSGGLKCLRAAIITFVAVAWLACPALCIPAPSVGPSSGYNPLTVYFNCGFTPNNTDAPLDIRYTLNSLVDFVSCTGTSSQSIGSGKGAVLTTLISCLWLVAFTVSFNRRGGLPAERPTTRQNMLRFRI